MPNLNPTNEGVGDSVSAPTSNQPVPETQQARQNAGNSVQQDPSTDDTLEANIKSLGASDIVRELQRLHAGSRYAKAKGAAMLDLLLPLVESLEVKPNCEAIIQGIHNDFQAHAAEIKAGIGGVMHSNAKTYASIVKGGVSNQQHSMPTPRPQPTTNRQHQIVLGCRQLPKDSPMLQESNVRLHEKIAPSLEKATGIKAKETIRLASNDIANRAFVVHGVPTHGNSEEPGDQMENLISQLESDNGIKIRAGKWAVPAHKLSLHRFSTLILEASSKVDQEKALSNRNFSHLHRILTIEHYRPPNSRPQQCNNCFRFAHVERNCRAKAVCGLCAGNHRSSEHTACESCQRSDPAREKGRACTHQAHKCSNCGRSHEAFSDLCEVRNEYFARHHSSHPNL